MRNVVLFSAAVLLCSMGCARGKGDTSRLSIGLPPTSVPSQHNKAQSKGITAFSTASLTHVIVNVSGSGISGQRLKVWDANDGHTLPTEFDIEVPSGNNRLIQVLAVYEDDASGSMNFYYGDVTQSLNPGPQSATVVVSPLSNGATSIGGQIMGRYLTAADSGPTGVLNIKFLPSSTKPEMLIESTLMLNGWFSAFGLSNVAFRYEVNGETLWGEPVSLNSAVFDPNANSGAEWNRRVKAALPVAIRADGGSSGYRPEEAQYYIWGYWGNAAAKAAAPWSTRSICKSGLSGTLSRMDEYSQTPAEWGTTEPLSVSNLINVGLTLPSESQLIDQVSPYSYVTFLGGDNSGCPNSPNTAADEFIKYIPIVKNLVDGNGKDSASGYRGPFRLMDTGNGSNQVVSVNQSANRVLTGSVLPGMGSIISSLKVYKKQGVDPNSWLNDPSCNALPTGYVFAGQGTINNSTNTFTINSTINDNDAANNTAAILCAVRTDGSMYDIGIYIGSYAFQYYPPSNNVMGTAWKVTLEASPGNNVHNGVCVPLTIQAVDNTGAAAQTLGAGAMSGITLTSDIGTGSQIFASDSTCQYPINAGYIPGTMMPTMRLWYRSADSGPSTRYITAYSGGMPSYGSAAVTLTDQGSAANYIRMIGAPPTINAYECYPLTLQAVYGSTSTQAANPNYGGPSTSTINSSNPALKFYDSAMCDSYGTSPGFNMSGTPPYQISTVFKYFKYNSSSAFNTTISASGNWGSVTSQNIVYGSGSINIPGAPIKWRLRGLGSNLGYGTCQPFVLESTDVAGKLVPLTGGGSMGITTTDTNSRLQFYDYSGCSSPGVTWPLDDETTQKTIYLKTNSSGPTTINISSSAPTLSLSQDVTVGPEPVAAVSMLFPGRTFMPGSTSQGGASIPMFVGETYTVPVIAMTQYSYQRATSYTSPPGVGLAFSGSAPFSTYGTASFLLSDAGSISVPITPMWATTSFQLYPMYLMQSWGLSQIYMPYVNVYQAPLKATNLTTVAGTNSEASTNNCQPHMIMTYGITPYISETSTIYKPSFLAESGGNALPNLVSITGATEVAFYATGDCSTGGPITSGNLVEMNQSARLLYVKSTGSTGSESITLSAGGSYGADPLDFNFTKVAVSAGAHTTYEVLGLSDMIEDQCQAFAVSAVDPAGRSTPSTATTINFSPSGALMGANIQFYSDAQCFSSLGGMMPWSSGDRAKLFYVKAMNVRNASYIQMDLNVSDNLGNSGMRTINILNRKA
ncbi:MAG: hypothetical protein KF799_15770, partial [Bdellovibrionales bacterium]|nr:hypothetical protein [Bdellovibrionales bacterium]